MRPVRKVISGVVVWLHDECYNCADWEQHESAFQAEHKKKLAEVLTV